MMPTNDTEEKRWQAVQARDRAADVCFLHGVITTGVYCYPSCPSRTALRKNTRLYSTREQDVADGLRACKRCLPDESPLMERHRQLIELACGHIRESTEALRVEALAAAGA